MKSFYLSLALVCLSVCAFGQTKPEPSKPAPMPTICADGTKECTEALKLENLDLKIGKIVDEFNQQAQKQFEQMVKPQMQPLQDERAKLIQKLNAAHPGYQWHDPTPGDSYQGFRAVPVPTKPVDKPATSK